jgi:hypothetical protein
VENSIKTKNNFEKVIFDNEEKNLKEIQKILFFTKIKLKFKIKFIINFLNFCFLKNYGFLKN